MSQGKRNRGSIKAASRAVANSNLGSWDKFMHHLFEMESFVKPAWKLQTGRQKVGTVIERFDIFPYEEPKRLRTSEKSGFIALSAIVLMTVMFFPELYNFFDGQIFLNVLPQPSHRSFASERMQLPRLIITPASPQQQKTRLKLDSDFLNNLSESSSDSDSDSSDGEEGQFVGDSMKYSNVSGSCMWWREK